ncbi:hypothetical protein [Ventosimonas gracilis]|nr:hypothetical protein [Ventosimonas gracilis]
MTMNRKGCFNSSLPLMGEGARGIVRAGLFTLLALTTHAVADEALLSQQLAACSLQENEKQRLACYDLLALNLKTAEKPVGSAGSEPINEDNALFKLSCAYFAKDC